jgi:hypothetical protein
MDTNDFIQLSVLWLIMTQVSQTFSLRVISFVVTGVYITLSIISLVKQ